MRRFDWYLVLLWLLVLVPVALIFRDWLFSLRPLVGADWPYISPQAMADFWPPRNGWIAYDGTGLSVAAWLPDFFIQLLAGLASLVHLPFAVYERIFFFIPAIAAGILGPYALALELSKSKVAGIVAAAAAIFNGYWTRIATVGQIQIFLAGGLAALFILLFIKIMQRVTPLRCAALVALFSALITLDLRIAYVVALAGVLIGAGYVAVLGIRAAAPGLATVTASCAAAFFPLHASWIIPSLYYHHLEPTLPTGYDLPFWLGVLSFFTLPQTLTLYHQWNTPIPGVDFPSAVLFAVLLALMLIPIIARPRQPWVVGFTLLALAFAFLMKGAQQPFAEVNTWFFQHVPGMYAFRDPGKFAVLIIIARAALIGYGVVLLGSLVPRVARLLPVAAIGIIVVGDAYALSPAISGTLHSRSIPADSVAVDALITSDAGFSRVLWLPRRTNFGVRTRLHPMVEVMADNPTFLYDYTANNDENAQWPLGWMERTSAGWLVRDLAIDRVVVPNADTDQQAFTIGWTPRARIEALIKRAPWLTFDRRIGGVDLYRVKQPRALVTASSAAIVLRGGSAADLRHFESAPLPAGAAQAPVLVVPADAPAMPATVALLPASSPEIAARRPAAPVSRLVYGTSILAVRAPGPHDAGIVGVERNADGSFQLPAQRSFFATDLVFQQPAASPNSTLKFRIRMKPSVGVRSFGIALFCDEDILTRMSCDESYALEWRGGVISLKRSYQGAIRTLAATPHPLSSGAWHTLTLETRHPDFGTQVIVGSLDGASLEYADSGLLILYRGREAVTSEGGSVELDSDRADVIGTGGDWAVPVSVALQPVIGTGAQADEADVVALPIGSASAVLRVPLLDADAPASIPVSSAAGCGAPLARVIKLPLAAPLFGKPLLSWRVSGTARARSSIVLIMHDGGGARACISIPVAAGARTVDLESYVTLQTGAGAFAPEPAPQRDDYALKFPHPRARLADDYVVTAIELPGARFEPMHLTLDVERSALDRDVLFAGAAAARSHALAAACAAFAGLPFAGRWSSDPSRLLMAGREIDPQAAPRAEELLAAPSFSVGISTPHFGGFSNPRVARAPVALQSGLCAYRSPSALTTDELRSAASASRPPLARRPAGVVLAAPDLLGIRSIAVKFAEVGELHYRADVPDAPAWIVFRQRYDAGWVARSGSAQLQHANADGLFNAYYVEKPGRVDIEFAPRSWAIAGEIISILSALALCAVALVLAVRRRV